MPRTFIFGGKAAPGYYIAKLIIKLITRVGDIINRDPAVKGRIKVVFLPNFNVKTGQQHLSGRGSVRADLHAGKEASGTGNMKFAMNGALTIGTLDGANIEIREEVGAENFFLFGLTAEEVQAVKSADTTPLLLRPNEELRGALDSLISGEFSAAITSLFRPMYDSLTRPGRVHAAGRFRSYVDCQDKSARRTATANGGTACRS